MAKKLAVEYHQSHVKALVFLAARMVKDNPAIADNPDYLWHLMTAKVGPKLADHSRCPGCQRSMKVTIYEADLLDALLIINMAKQVRKNLDSGMAFTDANKVHLPTLGCSQGILKRFTKCDYLGLIKQQDNWRGSGYWLLTRWAWKALRGEEIPKAAKYWEGELLGRSEATVRLETMFRNHSELVEQAILKRKAVRADRRSDFAGYNPADWRLINADSDIMR